MHLGFNNVFHKIQFQGAIVGMLAGGIVIFWISAGGLLWAPKPIPLEYRIDECPATAWNTVNYTQVLINRNTTAPALQL